MKVSEILQSSMTDDNTTIIIIKPIGDTDQHIIFKGCWYQDRALDFAEDEITKLTYTAEDNKIRMEVKA